MNINDYKAPAFHKDWLKDIFDKQQKLIDKYKDIEKMPDLPVNINTREGQKWIKDFLWRTSEEVAESYEAYEKIASNGFKPRSNKITKQHKVHQIEELIDALHFIVELLIITDKDWKWARGYLDDLEELDSPINDEEAYLQIFYKLGLVGNTLKNKPWKQTEIPTDENKFDKLLGEAFHSLFACLEYFGANEEKVYDYYCRKNQVNQFRQRSAY